MIKITLKLRSFLRYNFLSFFGYFSRPRNGIHILNSHFVDLNYNPSRTVFLNFLKNLNKSYTFINFDEACKLIKIKSKAKKPFLAFSFDDGFKECFNIIAPCLEEYGIRAAFFINSFSINASDIEKKDFLIKNLKVNYKKEFMSWSNIIDLHNRGHLIGNHTNNHIALKNLDNQKSYNEIYEGKKIIESKILSSCDYFAFPFGSPIFFDENGLKNALKLHKFIFTSGQYNYYFHNKNSNVFSRRHIEPNWPISHINYFLCSQRNYK
tara:strand:+ start:8 stop:805 length:798 start_codon:yes stop_codon:yes gene_type:complete